MTDNNKSLIVVLLDRSGSMSAIQSDMEGGFKAFVEEQRALPGECEVSLYQFDDAYDVVYERQPIGKPGVEVLDLRPRGWTALFDALGKTILSVGQQLAAQPEAERPSAVVVVTITDGEENSSKEFTGAQVKAMIEEQTAKYNWRFAYLGADASTFTAAQSLGVAAASTVAFDANAKGVQGMYASASAGIGAYRSHVQSYGSTDRSLDMAPARAKPAAADDKAKP